MRQSDHGIVSLSVRSPNSSVGREKLKFWSWNYFRECLVFPVKAQFRSLYWSFSSFMDLNVKIDLTFPLHVSITDSSTDAVHQTFTLQGVVLGASAPAAPPTPSLAPETSATLTPPKGAPEGVGLPCTTVELTNPRIIPSLQHL